MKRTLHSSNDNLIYTHCKPERRRAVSHYGNGCKQETKFCQLWSNTNREDKVYNLINNVSFDKLSLKIGKAKFIKRAH